MKGTVVALGAWQGRKAAARLVDGHLDDLLLDPPDDVPIPGAIYRAVADRPMKGAGGVTLRLSGDRRAFLRAPKGVRPGDALLVQVTGYAEPGKAIPVTQRLLFKSRFAIATPEAPGVNVSRKIRGPEARAALETLGLARVSGNMGLILRSLAEEAASDEVAADIDAVLEAARLVLADGPGRAAELLLDGPDAHRTAWRDWPVPDILADGADAFEAHGIPEAIDGALQSRLPLPGGAFAYVEATRALVAVDVNTGADTSPAAALKANLALARALPCALRLRGLGGQITLDLAPLAKRDRRQVEAGLRTAFRADPVETHLAGWTPLGHFELQRKRERAPLHWR